MHIASYEIPGYRFSPVGVSFAAMSKSGKGNHYFWMPPYQDKPDRLFRWLPGGYRSLPTWKENPIAGLPPKKREALLKFWKSQADIGLWIAKAKRAKS